MTKSDRKYVIRRKDTGEYAISQNRPVFDKLWRAAVFDTEATATKAIKILVKKWDAAKLIAETWTGANKPPAMSECPELEVVSLVPEF